MRLQKNRNRRKGDSGFSVQYHDAVFRCAAIRKHGQARRAESRSAEKIQDEINDRFDDPGFPLFFFLVLGVLLIREGYRIFLCVFCIFVFHSGFLSADMPRLRCARLSQHVWVKY